MVLGQTISKKSLKTVKKMSSQCTAYSQNWLFWKIVEAAEDKNECGG